MVYREIIKKWTDQVPSQAMIVKLLWLSLYLDFYFNPEFYGNLGRTEIENKRCCEMPRVLAHGFWCWHWDGEAVAPISAATWAHVCVVHMLHFPVKQERVRWHHMKKLFCLFQMSTFPLGTCEAQNDSVPRSCITQQQHEAPRCAVASVHRMFFVRGTLFQVFLFCFLLF